jgi:hypothetical protein
MVKKIFEVKFIGATNTQGSRIKIIDSLRGKSKVIPYNYSFNNVLDGAINFFIEEKGLKKEDISSGELKNSYIIIVNDFTIEL